MSPSPKVSICLVTYNRSQELCKTLDSLIVQSFSDFELLICDDCSPDNTRQICLEYIKKDSRIKYQRNQRNLGMPGNLNAGIKTLKGEYIANLHDGDIYDPNLLQKWTSALDADPKVAFVFNAYRELDINGMERKIYRETLPICFPGHVLLEDFFFKRWQFDSPVFGTVMARRSVYEKSFFFNDRFGFFSDVDMWMRLAENYFVAYIDEPLITLPSKKKVQHEFTLPFWQEQHTLERMFWEARLRHYHGRYFWLLLEIMRHISFALASRTWKFALWERRRFLNMITSVMSTVI